MTEKWHAEVEALRKIVLECGLTEETKWGNPCYTSGKKNIVLIHGFKEYCALLFFKGALMPDPEGLLIRQTENVQAGRQIRFAGLQDIAARESLLKDYVRAAIAVEEAGLNIAHKKTEDFPVPEEFRARLEQEGALKAAFEGLTPGRQRAYLLHFAGAKQPKTREARIDKHRPRILEGKGLDD